MIEYKYIKKENKSRTSYYKKNNKGELFRIKKHEYLKGSENKKKGGFFNKAEKSECHELFGDKYVSSIGTGKNKICINSDKITLPTGKVCCIKKNSECPAVLGENYIKSIGTKTNKYCKTSHKITLPDGKECCSKKNLDELDQNELNFNLYQYILRLKDNKNIKYNTKKEEFLTNFLKKNVQSNHKDNVQSQQSRKKTHEWGQLAVEAANDNPFSKEIKLNLISH